MNTIDPDRQREDGEGRAPEWAAARHALGEAAPPDHVEAALLQAFARRHRRLPWYRRCSLDAITAWAGIGAAGFALALALALAGGGLRPAGPAPVMAVAPDGFLALVPAERIAAAQPQLKQADLSRQALVRLGIPIVADAPNELVHAELLVAATGEPLAIRLAVN